MTPLVFGDEQREALCDLRARAALYPIDIVSLVERLKEPAGKAAHMAQMDNQTVRIPFGFMVTYSVEIQPQAGLCRHMSMSSPAKDRLPSPEAVNMIAEALGFVGGFKMCKTWIEDLQRGSDRAHAVNLVQPVSVTDPNASSQN